MRNLLRLAPLLLLSLMTARAESFYEIPVKDIDGKATTLAPLKGRVLLIVNVASECGYTPQYEGLQAIYKKYEGKGLTVLGFPCNQFGAQEPGTNAEIKKFCSTKFQVTFPLFDKIDVNGVHRHPLYVALAGKGSPFLGDIGWNFTKFLVDRDGKILKRFDSAAEPDSLEVTKAIEAALAAK
jgi:glutathione peroxidase